MPKSNKKKSYKDIMDTTMSQLDKATVKINKKRKSEADDRKKATTKGMVGQLKSESARQASNKGLAGQLKSEAARQTTAPKKPKTDYSEEAIKLFKKVHGGNYDPKSSKDKGKLEKMKSMLTKQGGLGDMSANQFALQVYRNS